MTIALLCPTKGRPQQFWRMVESAERTALNKPAIYATFPDGEYESYKKDGLDLGSYVKFLDFPEWPTAHKWNILAEKALKDSSNKLFMLAADDMVFTTPHWDTALLEHYNALENKIRVYSLLDSRDADGTPHIIVTREWIEAMGWFVPPIFLHWYVDSWTAEIARANNCFTHMKDYLLIHDKPSDKGEGDATHTGIRALGWRERDQWAAWHCVDWLELQKEKLKSICIEKNTARIGDALLRTAG